MLSVVGFHAFPNWIRGGFIGVDVFFVISGFLISTIIFENLERGFFSFSEFYARRIKRIFPALLVVLVASYAFGWFALLADEYKQLGKHIAAGAGFLSNFVLWSEAGYFDNSAETKPLLHLWSLGVEEQFYIAWPLLLWFAWQHKFNLLTLTIVVGLVSFMLNVKGVSKDLVATFYSPQTRFWELLSGSILAWFALYKKDAYEGFRLKADRWLAGAIYRGNIANDGRTLANTLSFSGLLLLGYGFWHINKNLGFPGGWALVPILGTVLIVLAGSRAWINRNILSNKIAVWFGLISFPLYLWHWPLLSFARIVESEIPSRGIRVAIVVLSIILAWATYKFVERPLRLGGHGKFKVITLVVLMVVIGCVGYYTYKGDGLSFRRSLANISPPIESLKKDDPLAHSACMAMYGLSNETIRYCRIFGDKKPRIALIGDSHAAALFSGLSGELARVNNEGLLMMGGRLFINVANYPDGNQFEIDAYKGGIIATTFVAKEKSIDTVVMVSRGPSYMTETGNFYLLTDRSITDKKKVFEIGMRDTLDLLIDNNKNVIFVLENPTLDFDPEICKESRPLRFSNKLNDCLIPVEKYHVEHGEYRDLVFSVLKDYPAVKVFDSAAYFCDQFFCRARIGNNILYGDSDHLSVAGSAYLARALIKVINGGDSSILGGPQ